MYINNNMIVVIYPTGTKRSIHMNHFASEAELADADVKYITTEQFLSIPMPQWEPDTIFLIRVGATTITEILHVLEQYYSNWKHFPFWEWGQCVIKPSIGTLGNGIYFVEAQDVADRIKEIISTDDEFYKECDIIVQKRIVNKKNIPESIRVFCFNGEPTCSITLSNVMELQHDVSQDLQVKQDILYNNGEVVDTMGYDMDFNTVSNLHNGGIAGPYFPNEQLKEQCRKICKATGIEFTAIDFVQDQQGQYYCLEANIAPHLYRAYTIHSGKVNHPKMIFNYLLDKSKKDSIIL